MAGGERSLPAFPNLVLDRPVDIGCLKRYFQIEGDLAKGPENLGCVLAFASGGTKL